jgi:hypothetical protein
MNLPPRPLRPLRLEVSPAAADSDDAEEAKPVSFGDEPQALDEAMKYLAEHEREG